MTLDNQMIIHNTTQHARAHYPTLVARRSILDSRDLELQPRWPLTLSDQHVCLLVVWSPGTLASFGPEAEVLQSKASASTHMATAASFPLISSLLSPRSLP